jgi:hypothetical protein
VIFLQGTNILLIVRSNANTISSISRITRRIVDYEIKNIGYGIGLYLLKLCDLNFIHRTACCRLLIEYHKSGLHILFVLLKMELNGWPIQFMPNLCLSFMCGMLYIVVLTFLISRDKFISPHSCVIY